MTNPPPFPVSIRLPLNEADYPVSIRLQARPDALVLEDETFLEDTTDMLSMFAAGVNAGFMGHRGEAWAQMEESVRQLDEAQRQWVFHYRVRSLPETAWLQLLALLSQTHHAFSPLEQVNIHAENSSFPLLTEADLLQRDRMPARPAPPFDLDFDETMDFRYETLGIDLTFQNPLSKTQYDTIAEEMNVWGNLLIFGAYFLDFEEDDEALGNLGDCSRVDEHTVGYVVDDFNYPIHSLYPVIQYAVKLHATQPLVRLSIDIVE